jgi:fructuronate reductase
VTQAKGTKAELSRSAGHGRPAATVRIVHLGLGNFFRAHQAWYTDRSPDAAEWGIAAFTGRSAKLAEALAAQDYLYTLVTRTGGGDRFDILSSLSHTHPPAEHDALLGYMRSPDVRAITLTVTEAGYLRDSEGGLDRDRPDIRDEIEALRRDPTAPVQTIPARLVAGFIVRRTADAGPLTLVPCDNLPDNGAVVERVLRDLVELVDPHIMDWMTDNVSIVTTMVDRITPKTTPDDIRTVTEATGFHDRAPVITEPFSEWVISGAFPGGRPRWEEAGATFTDDVEPYEQRKLWLLNGGHSLLAYTGSLRGHVTVADALADDTCRGWLEEWWDEASAHLTLPPADVATYRAALLDRFANPRLGYRLEQIATDGSQKLPVRILPALREERAAGRVPSSATRVLAAWVCHLRGAGAPVQDPRADEMIPLAAGPLSEAVARVLNALDPAVAADDEMVKAVQAHAEELK